MFDLLWQDPNFNVYIDPTWIWVFHIYVQYIQCTKKGEKIHSFVRNRRCVKWVYFFYLFLNLFFDISGEKLKRKCAHMWQARRLVRPCSSNIWKSRVQKENHLTTTHPKKKKNKKKKTIRFAAWIRDEGLQIFLIFHSGSFSSLRSAIAHPIPL